MHAYMYMVTWFESERKFGKIVKFNLHQWQSQARVYMVSVGNYRKFCQTFCVFISGY